jgi:hypothetical protein
VRTNRPETALKQLRRLIHAIRVPSRRDLLVTATGTLAACSVLAVGAVAFEADDPEVRAAAAGPIEPADAPRQLRANVTDAQEVDRRRADRDASEPEPEPTADDRDDVWGRLADCESGFRDNGGNVIPNSRRWDFASGFFEGGLQFHPTTWEEFRDPSMPGHAGQATPEQQIAVAERVLAAQGWGAWPLCSKRVGAA